MRCLACGTAPGPDVHQVGVADAVGEQTRHADDAVAVSSDGHVTRLLERSPQGLGRATVSKSSAARSAFARTQSMSSSELSTRTGMATTMADTGTAGSLPSAARCTGVWRDFNGRGGRSRRRVGPERAGGRGDARAAGLSVTVLEAADEIGGGTRTGELTVPGVLHDVCSAVHPFGVASPFFASLPLDRHGLEWRWPEIDLAHPLDGGRGRRARALAAGHRRAAGTRWTSVAHARSGHSPSASTTSRPSSCGPAPPCAPTSPHARPFRTARRPAGDRVRRGSSAPTRPGACSAGWPPTSCVRSTARPRSAAGVMFVGAGHALGWPVAAGGSHAITRALASLLSELGGTIETGIRVTSLTSCRAPG